ncbi:MAG: hypothetical protein NTW29_12075 [Bacteroidetes bacterium]|nr:hypothetical protein [Bacteroidota bacterium]
MICKKNVLTFFFFLCSLSLFSQCDTSFYFFKRAIIDKLSEKLDSDLGFKIPAKTIKLAFSDYQRFTYTIADPKSTLGFVCIRNKACNTFSDSFCITNKNKDTYDIEKTLFENFMSTDDSKICDSVNYLHTLAKLIENPIGGWKSLEEYYFRFLGNNDLDTYYKGRVVLLTIPVYFFLDKRLLLTYFFKVRISGTEQKDMLIEEKQKVINK